MDKVTGKTALDRKTEGITFIVCPFFEREARKSISCEGIEPGTRISIRSDDTYELRQIKAQFCGSYNWADCLIAQALLIAHGEKRDFAPRLVRAGKDTSMPAYGAGQTTEEKNEVASHDKTRGE